MMAAKHQGEEVLAAAKCSKSDQMFDTIVGHIEDIIVGDDFQHLQQNFMDKYCMQFDEVDENKLEYTDIHKEYIEIIETYMEKELVRRMPNFKMADFQKQLVARNKELDGEVFEMLLTFSDFLAFKELVLDHRAAKEGRSFDFSQGFVVHSVGSQSSTTSVSSAVVVDSVLKHNMSDNEPMRISLDFNDDIADEFDDEEKQNPDSEQLNNDMDLLVIGTGLRPPAKS